MRVRKFLLGSKKRVVILLVLLGISYFVWTKYFGGNGEDLEEGVVGRGDVVEELILAGSVVADEHASLVFQTGGKIAWVDVNEGDELYKGQALAKLDTVGLNSTFQRARADLRAAEANLEEVHDDVKDNDSDESFDEKNTRTAAETAKDKAYEAVVIAENNLRSATLVSPFEGIVTFVANPFGGVNVLASQTQIEVINPETIHFEVSADQSEVIDIREGDSVRIFLDAAAEETVNGVVGNVSYAPAVGEIGAVYSVRVSFEDLDEGRITYRVGMTGDAYFELDRKADVFYVPAGFVSSDDDGNYLLTSKNGDKLYVEVGLEGEERTEVSGDGLAEGMLIYD